MAQHWNHLFSVTGPGDTAGFMPVTHRRQLTEDDFPRVAAEIAAKQGWPSCQIWLMFPPEPVEV